MGKVRQETLFMTLAKSESLPWKGETRIMEGGYGVRYAVTVHQIVSMTENKQHRCLKVRATRRPISEPDAEE